MDVYEVMIVNKNYSKVSIKLFRVCIAVSAPTRRGSSSRCFKAHKVRLGL